MNENKNDYDNDNNPEGFHNNNQYHSDNTGVNSNPNSVYSYNYTNLNSNYTKDYIGEAPNIYPTPTIKEVNKKAKKGKRFVGFMKLAGSALVFGLLAGVVFQGFTILTKPKDTKAPEQNVIEQAEVELPEIEDIIDNLEPNTKPTTSTSDEIVTDVSDVVENVMPSIVAINSSGTSIEYDIFGRQVEQYSSGSGSGIIIGQSETDILIVTNNHVVQGAETVEIVFNDDKTAQAVVKGSDASSDLAVLSVSMNDISEETAKSIKIAALGNSEEVKPGEMVIAIGNALGYGQSVTVGYISAVNREVTIENLKMTLLQTDAAINPGNSGGALINTSGEVIGINSVKYASKEVEGIGYAIPISDAIPMINELMNREELKDSEKGFLGIYLNTAQNVTEVYAQRFNMPVGVYVNDIVEGSPAQAAGLKQGYIITKANDRSIKTVEDLVNFLSYKRTGESINLTVSVLDNGKYVEKELSVTLGDREE